MHNSITKHNFLASKIIIFLINIPQLRSHRTVSISSYLFLQLAWPGSDLAAFTSLTVSAQPEEQTGLATSSSSESSLSSSSAPSSCLSRLRICWRASASCCSVRDIRWEQLEFSHRSGCNNNYS